MRDVPNSVDFPALEQSVLARWARERTFERSLEQRADAPRFVFYDGPPFATGLPHYGHLLTSYIKDVVPRYQTMRGHFVPRRWGWDCHGLPVELEVEKELGLRTAAEVEVGGFNAACRALVLRYADEWETTMTRAGRWVDFAGAYRTMDPEYTESVVWCFAELHRRGLVYEGEKVVPYCTRCQTGLSNFETRLDNAYRDRVDPTVTVRFPLAGERGALLAWTTTPWTLPANAALAVHPDLAYVRVDTCDESVWLAEAALERYGLGAAVERDGLAASVERQGFALRGVVGERRLGRELVGLRALAPFGGEVPVLAADWVTAEDGTGAVHLAPAYGEDDHALCAAHGVTGASPVRADGTFDATVQALAGLDVHAATEPVMELLAARGRLFARGTVEHEYPHCWRCDRPLIYRAVPSWYVAVSQLRERLVACNRRVRWVPPHLGEERFADWLANARDWAVSRQRYWGAPVPVWRCSDCRATHVVGSSAELAELSRCAAVDWHRPAVDELMWPCSCGGTLQRVPDVLDCWFESGAMPFASQHVPFENAEAFRASFPGDFVVEYVAQTRGWFYTMLVLSTALYDEPPFKTAVCHGVLLGEDGRKLSKRLKNYPDPELLVREHGSDALRAALLMSGAASGSDVKFSAATVRDAVRRLHLPLWNVLHLVTSYALLDGYQPPAQLLAPDAAASPLDRALWSEAELLRTDVERAMAAYDFAGAYAVLEEFVATLSTWYLRLAKPALWRDGLDPAKHATYTALYAALVQLARVAAPFLPFVAEAMYEALGFTRSVHLEDWPAPRDAVRDDALVAEMRQLRAVVRLARHVREQAGVKHRQPLRTAVVGGVTPDVLAKYGQLLATELNVKHVALLDGPVAVARDPILDFGKLGKRLRAQVKQVAAAVAAGAYEVTPAGGLAVAGVQVAPDELSWRTRASHGPGCATRDGLVVRLDLAVDDVLVREGLARELSRAVQDLRKQAGLRYGEPVAVSVAGDAPVVTALLAEHAGWLCAQVSATALSREPLAAPLGSCTLDLGGAPASVAIERAR